MRDASAAPTDNNNRYSAPVRRMNPVSIVALNVITCFAAGSLAAATNLSPFSVFATGWVGGAVLTLILLSLYAMRTADYPLEPAESGRMVKPDASLQEVLRAWDMDRAFEAAHGATIRAWDADSSADRHDHPRKRRVPTA